MSTSKTPRKRAKSPTIKKVCRTYVKQAGINSNTGHLLKGWHYVDGVPTKSAPKTAKKSAPKTPKKKGAKVIKMPKKVGIF